MAKKALTQDTTDYENITPLDPIVEDQATTLQPLFDKGGKDQATFMNTVLQVELADETLNNSGSNTTGHNSTSITANNVGNALEENRLLIITNTSNIGNKANDNEVVKLTGNQSIAGVKTFTSLPTIPVLPLVDTDSASKKYIDDVATAFELGELLDNSIPDIKNAPDVKVGSLAALLTTIKTNVTAAINEIVTNIGSLLALTTTDKSSIVNAINEIDSKPTSVKIGENLLINGNFAVNQRVVTGSVVLLAGEYGHDRFRAGSGGCTYTFATLLNVTTITISAGTLEQEVEGLNLQSGTHVLSWGGTAQGQIDGGGFAATGVTGTLVGGTNAIVEFNAGTLSLAKLEEGSTPTDFIHDTFDKEFQKCLRYFEKSYPYLIAPGASSSLGSIIEYDTRNRTDKTFGRQYKVEKRDVPTTILYSGINGTSGTVYNGSDKVSSIENGGTSGYRNVTISGGVIATATIYHYTADAEL